ncbi:MAG: cyclopropane-fatty-acyl-phospholipid synthase family protein [Pseudomonadota bacterium]
MRTESIDSRDFLEGSRKPTGLDNLARKVVRARLQEFTFGELKFTENGRTEVFGRMTPEFPVTAHIEVHDPRFFSDVAFAGTIGAGEAFMHQHWSCSDLTSLVRILLKNREVMEGMDSGAAWLTRPFQKLFHWLNRNTEEGSRRNIAAHYDLGNDFYSLWLDPTMMYSSAFFESPKSTLEEASIRKLDKICQQLELKPDDHVVEIGTGWGGFAMHAAKHYGCRVTTTTISKEQYEWAQRSVRDAGLDDRITLKLEDYRKLDGQYDKLVSIEMIEAVGHEFHDTFFRKCASLLKPNGQMLIQAINIADQHYKRYTKSVDFIKRYIFPGGCLTSVTAMSETLTRVTDMRILNIEDIGPHYASTLRHWRERFFEKIEAVRAQGFSDEFIRMWHYYLCYCEGAFIERSTGVIQMHVVRPHARPAALPAS